jgi:excisionase family DNA binding protein
MLVITLIRRNRITLMSEKEFRPPYEVETAARRLNLTPYQIRHAYRRGELGGFRVGKSIRIWPEEIDRLLGVAKAPEHDDAAVA